jgi:hypothetical protein
VKETQVEETDEETSESEEEPVDKKLIMPASPCPLQPPAPTVPIVRHEEMMMLQAVCSPQNYYSVCVMFEPVYI